MPILLTDTSSAKTNRKVERATIAEFTVKSKIQG